jgi:shikimate kinase
LQFELIILIGLPGSGKSTVGRQLARRFCFSFVDSDHVIEQAVGCSIREFFEREGEERFRDVEQETLARLTVVANTSTASTIASATRAITSTTGTTSNANPPVPVGAGELQKAAEDAHQGAAPSPAGTVLSTGGGAVLRPANRAAIRAGGHVVYLRSTPEDLYRRLRNDQQRPLLQGTDPLQRLRDLYAARDPLYRETAHFVVETGRPSVAMLTNMIAMQLELAGVVPATPSVS